MAGAEAMVLRRLPRAAELVGPVPRESCPRLIFWHTPGTLAASKWHKMPRRDTRKPLSCKVLGGAAWGRSSALNLLVVGSIPTRPTTSHFQVLPAASRHVYRFL